MSETKWKEKCEKLHYKITRLENTLRAISHWREDAIEYDKDMGNKVRQFLDNDDWDLLESYASDVLEDGA